MKTVYMKEVLKVSVLYSFVNKWQFLRLIERGKLSLACTKKRTSAIMVDERCLEDQTFHGRKIGTLALPLLTLVLV